LRDAAETLTEGLLRVVVVVVVVVVIVVIVVFVVVIAFALGAMNTIDYI